MRGYKRRSRAESTGSLPETSEIANRCAKDCMSYGSIGGQAIGSITRCSREFMYCFFAAGVKEKNRRASSGGLQNSRDIKKRLEPHEKKKQHLPIRSHPHAAQ